MWYLLLLHQTFYGKMEKMQILHKEFYVHVKGGSVLSIMIGTFQAFVRLIRIVPSHSYPGQRTETALKD